MHVPPTPTIPRPTTQHNTRWVRVRLSHPAKHLCRVIFHETSPALYVSPILGYLSTWRMVLATLTRPCGMYVLDSLRNMHVIRMLDWASQWCAVSQPYGKCSRHSHSETPTTDPIPARPARHQSPQTRPRIPSQPATKVHRPTCRWYRSLQSIYVCLVSHIYK